MRKGQLDILLHSCFRVASFATRSPLLKGKLIASGDVAVKGDKSRDVFMELIDNEYFCIVWVQLAGAFGFKSIALKDKKKRESLCLFGADGL